MIAGIQSRFSGLLCNRVLLKTVFFLIVAGCFVACANKQGNQTVDIPEGMAARTLKEFARQTKVELLFDLQSVSGVRTNAVKGKYDPRTALEIMLENTPLKFDFESETGAFAVSRKGLSSCFLYIQKLNASKLAQLLEPFYPLGKIV